MPGTDTAHAEHGLGVAAHLHPSDSARWHPVLRVEKYDADQVAWAVRETGLAVPKGAHFKRLGLQPYDTVESVGNLLTTAGLTRLVSRLMANTDIALANTTARLGVGDGSTAAAVGDTDLSAAAGSTHRYFNPMDASNPSQAAGVLTAVSTFASANGNFAWAEWGIDIGTATVTGGTTVNACLFNHKVQSLGTKVSGSSWVATATITIV